MKTHLNTLFITQENSYLHKEGAAICVKIGDQKKIRIPLHNLEGIVCFGWDTTVSAALMHACGEANVSLSFHSPYGKFLASSYGGISGNILLRREQYRVADHETEALEIAKNMIAAKIYNTRLILQRNIRDHGSKNPEKGKKLNLACDALQNRIKAAQSTSALDSLRGIEGDAAATYFAVFNQLLTLPDDQFHIKGRSKRPPLDYTNALLSFTYTLLSHDCRSACESCGLDPQSGFLHQPRPGRASLALDLMEEFRPILADRLTLSLINRKQITSDDFTTQESGAVHLKEDSRKIVLQAWQERKQEQLTHPFLEEKITIGMLPHIQARLLARYLRGDIDTYPAFLSK